VNLGAPVRLWRNVGAGDASHPMPMGHWLAVTLRQPGSNRDAIGSWIEVRVGDTTMRRERTVGGGQVGGQLGPTHFGLGPSATLRSGCNGRTASKGRGSRSRPTSRPRSSAERAVQAAIGHLPEYVSGTTGLPGGEAGVRV
jgi:ASPIC and UnbV